jgi:hypothetical protein
LKHIEAIGVLLESFVGNLSVDKPHHSHPIAFLLLLLLLVHSVPNARGTADSNATAVSCKRRRFCCFTGMTTYIRTTASGSTRLRQEYQYHEQQSAQRDTKHIVPATVALGLSHT